MMAKLQFSEKTSWHRYIMVDQNIKFDKNINLTKKVKFDNNFIFDSSVTSSLTHFPPTNVWHEYQYQEGKCWIIHISQKYVSIPQM